MVSIIVCKAAVINQQGQLLLLRCGAGAPSRPLGWDLVGGSWDGDENLEHTIKREAREESGLMVNDLQVIRAVPERLPEGSYKLSVSFLARTTHNRISLGRQHDMFSWVGPHDLAVYGLPLLWHAAAVAAFKFAGRGEAAAL